MCFFMFCFLCFFFSSRRRHTRCALVTGVQTCALPISAVIFFAYVGFDAVSTAAEETKDPQRNVPIGLIGSLGICTVFYLLVAAGAIGAYGAPPVFGTGGEILIAGSPELAARCAALLAAGTEPPASSNEALAPLMRAICNTWVGTENSPPPLLESPPVHLII